MVEIGNQTNSDRTVPRSVVTLLIFGSLTVFLALFLLYRGERINNRAWIVKSASALDPAKPESRKGFVKISGMPGGQLIEDEISGKRFVYLQRLHYRYGKDKKTRTDFVNKGGKSEMVTREYYANDWIYQKRDLLKAPDLMIGAVHIRLKEAELIGEKAWDKTFFPGKKGGPEASPSVGDQKAVLSGIPADQPLFAAGTLNGAYLEGGGVFIVSSLSEGMTLEELKETLWFTKTLCFFLLLAGTFMLIHPLLFSLSRYKEAEGGREFLSKLGWVSMIFLSVIISFLVVKFSYYTADLVWMVLVLIIVLPAVRFFRRRVNG